MEREKQFFSYKGNLIRLSADFSAETSRDLAGQERMGDIFKMLKERNYEPKNFTQQSYLSEMKARKKLFLTKKS